MTTQIPSHWKLSRLGELSVTIQYGYTEKAQQTQVGPKFLRITDIQDERVNWSEVPFCIIDDKEKHKYLLQSGDLVFARTGATVGKSFLISGSIPESVFASYLIRVRLNSDVEPKYISNFFRSNNYWRQISESQAGIGQPNVNGKKLAQIKIPLPPLHMQQRIVAEIEKQFSRLDEAVTNLKRVKANLKRYRASVLKAAVEGRLVETEAEVARREGREYESGKQLLERILETRRREWKGKGQYKEPAAPDVSELPELPEGWAWGRYSQAGSLQLGRQRAPKYHAGPNMRPYLRVQNVFEDRIDLSDVMEMDFPPNDFERYQLHSGDLLLNEGQSPELLGRPAIYRGELPGSCFTNTLIRFRAANGVSVDFALIVSRHFMHAGRFVDEGMITTNIAHLSVGRLATVEFPLPPLAEQQRIVAEVDRRLSLVRETEAQVEANLKRAERLRQSVLQKAFSGELVRDEAG